MVIDFTDKLHKNFFMRPVTTVAKNLLGKIIVRYHKQELLSAIIVETEAYSQDGDEASHSFRGATERNKVMFLEGGFLYVYFTYGMHFCANVVTGRQDKGEAVLIRAVQPLTGIEIMALNRFGNKTLTAYQEKNLTNGPAKFCESFGIKRRENGLNLLEDKIFIVNNRIKNRSIISTARIGIKKSKELMWRFYLADNKFVSR